MAGAGRRKPTGMYLSQMVSGQPAQVVGVERASAQVGDATLRRLMELGFVEGEPVRVLRRGPGGREPLAVQVGQTQFALRWVEAQCVRVQPLSTQV